MKDCIEWSLPSAARARSSGVPSVHVRSSAALLAVLLVATAAVCGDVNARDPGINQPGAAGNRPVDPGINQPGAAGNVGKPRDPGINQPGAAGNVGVGRDPGLNQPGAAGNVGVGRDPGINQPGVAGNVNVVARQTVRR